MSYFIKEKVLRIPLEEKDKKNILEKYQVSNLWDIEKFNSDIFEYGIENKFQISPSGDLFIDYVLFRDYSDYEIEISRNRSLTENEKKKYESIFHKFYEGFDMDKVRLVEFIWNNDYTCPISYNEPDPFYDEI